MKNFIVYIKSVAISSLGLIFLFLYDTNSGFEWYHILFLIGASLFMFSPSIKWWENYLSNKNKKSEKEVIILKNSSHIGQVKIENAKAEICRLEAQTNKKWKKDFSKYLVEDNNNESDTKSHKLCDGYCWVVQEI